jgi:hypothetical protein
LLGGALMPIASVVVTLDPHPELRAHALSVLTSDPRIEVGEPLSAVVPAVVDTATSEEGENLVNGLTATVGVLRVDVVSIDFSCDDAESN